MPCCPTCPADRVCEACGASTVDLLLDDAGRPVCAKCMLEAHGICPACGHPADCCECEGWGDAPAARWHDTSDRERQP